MSDSAAPAPSPRPSSRPIEKGLDEYSEVLGMTPREHEAKMRKWYVMLAIALFFAVFGEGILMLSAKAKERREATSGAARSAPAPDSAAGQAR
ncbi:MAG TPA: hypothetical protein VFV33_12165 [Gemmatimonadaceae bacterium]|nr:hypothetical protein [Gemmatimonadaceae bacterium]